MTFDLNNLDTLTDYTNAGKHFIGLYDTSLLMDDEVIGLSINSIYKAKLRLDKTKSVKRYGYTKRSVFNTITKYIASKSKYNKIPDYITKDTPLTIILQKEESVFIQDFIQNVLTKREQICAKLLCYGYSYTEIKDKMNISRQRVTQLIQKIKKKYNIYVLD